MKYLFLSLLLAGAVAPCSVRADELVTRQAPPLIASQAKPGLATVMPYIVGLKEPQGMVLEPAGRFNSGLLVVDYGAGEVLRFNGVEPREVVARGLKGPSQVVYFGQEIVVSERLANRVVRLDGGQAIPLGGEIIEPMGLVPGLQGIHSGPEPEQNVPAGEYMGDDNLYAISGSTSSIYRLEDSSNWKLIYQAPVVGRNRKGYGLRCLARDGDTFFVSDEVNGEILMMSRNGRMTKFASGIQAPSGLTEYEGWIYVCDQSEGGKLWKLDKNGVKTLAAQNLGRPSNVLFLYDKTALVSDRNGRVLKLNWAG